MRCHVCGIAIPDSPQAPPSKKGTCAYCMILKQEAPKFGSESRPADLAESGQEIDQYRLFMQYRDGLRIWYENLMESNKQVPCLMCGRSRWSFVLKNGGFICSKCHPQEYKNAKLAKSCKEAYDYDEQPPDTRQRLFLSSRNIPAPPSCTRKIAEQLIRNYLDENVGTEPASLAQLALLKVLSVPFHFAYTVQEASWLIDRHQKENVTEDDKEEYYAMRDAMEESPTLTDCGKCGTRYDTEWGDCSFCYRKKHPSITSLTPYYRGY